MSFRIKLFSEDNFRLISGYPSYSDPNILEKSFLKIFNISNLNSLFDFPVFENCYYISFDNSIPVIRYCNLGFAYNDFISKLKSMKKTNNVFLCNEEIDISPDSYIKVLLGSKNEENRNNENIFRLWNIVLDYLYKNYICLDINVVLFHSNIEVPPASRNFAPVHFNILAGPLPRSYKIFDHEAISSRVDLMRYLISKYIGEYQPNVLDKRYSYVEEFHDYRYKTVHGRKVKKSEYGNISLTGRSPSDKRPKNRLHIDIERNALRNLGSYNGYDGSESFRSYDVTRRFELRDLQKGIFDGDYKYQYFEPRFDCWSSTYIDRCQLEDLIIKPE